ncbi:hypothetical protein JTB14_007142 [Gonioctena quinquepunctata]|nr:hypothetical protein JTB14_007142 [Gonioctena quinquepunctata]
MVEEVETREVGEESVTGEAVVEQSGVRRRFERRRRGRDQQEQNGGEREQMVEEVETREVGEERVTGETRREAGVEQSGVWGRFERGRRERG